MTTLDDVMAEAIRLTRSATNDDVARFIAVAEAYSDTGAALEREACLSICVDVALRSGTSKECVEAILSRNEHEPK